MNDSLKKFYSQYSPTQKVEQSSSSKQKVKEAVFANLHKINPAPEPSAWKIHLNSFWLKSYTVVPLALLLMIAGSAFASADSLPGDVFYPVKRTVENLRIITAPTEENKQSLEVEFASKRLLELEKLQEAQARKSPKVKLENQKSENDQIVSTQDGTEKPKIENTEAADSPEQESDTKPEKTTQKVSSFAKKFIKLKKSTQDTQEKASQDAQKATEFLETTQRKLEGEKRSEQAKQIQEKLKEFRKRQADRNRDNNSDENKAEERVRGDFRQGESSRDSYREDKNEQENKR